MIPEEATGYLSRSYALSLSGLGSPRFLPRSRAWILERHVPGSAELDAMGCYPLLCCGDWQGLGEDLYSLSEETNLVAVSAVIDPFCGADMATLQRCFPDLAVVYKQHFVVDLQLADMSTIANHHRRNVKKGLASVEIEIVKNPRGWEDDFLRLYAVLRARHGISGWAAFPDESLRRQIRVPGMVAILARQGDDIVGITIWYVQGAIGFYHLGAYTDSGYAARASYASFSVAIPYFANIGLRWLDLGAAAGVRGDQTDGLARFKRGWATGSRPAYLGGRILNRRAYAALTEASGQGATTYFPTYRAGEFGSVGSETCSV